MATTSLMSLNLPTPTVTIGPEWATQLNTALTVVDSHDHSSGKGAKIKTNGLQIDANLSFNSFSATDLLSIKLDSLLAALTGTVNANSVYSVAGNLYYTNASGSAVQITSGGSVVSTPSSLTTVQSDNINTDLTIISSDPFVLLRVDTSAPRTITLPLCAGVANGRLYIIKDVTGQSFQNPITVATVGGDLIDGTSSYVIDSDQEAVWVVADGATNYNIA